MKISLATFALLLAAPAWAGLGGKVDSAPHAIEAHEKFDAHKFATVGTAVRQYATSDGTVFAIAFDGRALPDLASVLGTKYADYLAEARKHNSRRVLSISTPDLELHLMKLPRGFTGSARIPSLVPQGVSAAELQ